MRTGEQNAPLIDEILSLKQKQAKLLGFESYADVSLASKMAASVAEIEELHELLAAKATPAAHRELAELKEYAAGKGHEGNLEHWDVPYWAERLREELCGNQIYGTFVPTLHAIDATPARWHGDVGYSPLDGTSAALHPTH